MQSTYSPLRTLRDVEELESVPLEQRIFSWNLNDWIARGCALAPDKVAIQYVADGDPDRAPVTMTYRELQRRSNQAANLFHSLGVSGGDAVLFLLPNVPELFVVMLGSLAAGIACSVNWMLKAEQLGELIRSTKAKVIVALGPTPGYEIWENVAAIRAEIPASVRILSVPGPGGQALPDSDLETLAARHPGDKLVFAREIKPDDVAAYIHSGGTTGSPKLVKLTHRGFSYKCWANAVVMAHTADDVIFAEYPMFHIAGIFGKGYLAIAHGMSIVIPSPLGARDKRFIDNYWKFVERYGITIFSGVPTTLAQLAKSRPQGEKPRLAARLCLHRLDRLPGRGRAPDRGDDRRAGAAHLWRDGIHPERLPGAARRRSEIRLARHPPALHAGQDGRARRRRPHQARVRRRRDRRGGGEGSEHHARLRRSEIQRRHVHAGRLVQFRRPRPYRCRRLPLAHRPGEGRHHPRRPQYRSVGDRGDAAQASPR